MGQTIYDLVKKLFPICRSITGQGFRDSLKIIQEIIPILKINEVPSGSKVMDWTIPPEWNIVDAFIKDSKGKKIIDFKKSNLHVVSYSKKIHQHMSFNELKKNLFTLPEQPDAIPYVTAYYKSNYWGFCLSHEQFESFNENETYEVMIDSHHNDNGVLNYGEILIPGKSDKEIFISTYLCHPSLANNELSGPCVTTYLAKWLTEEKRKYSYRIIFIPETIGSITYLANNLEVLKKKVIAGFNINCVGDDRDYSFLPSRYGKTLADKVALKVLNENRIDFKQYSFLEKGSDERQYCAPGVDLPVVSIMRTKYGSYPEYHTSKDNLNLVSPKGLQGGFEIIQKAIIKLETTSYYQATCLGEPQMGKRDLYPSVGTKTVMPNLRNMMHVLSYADGTNDRDDLCSIIGIGAKECDEILAVLLKNKLIRELS